MYYETKYFLQIITYRQMNITFMYNQCACDNVSTYYMLLLHLIKDLECKIN